MTPTTAINPAAIGPLANDGWVKAGHPLCLIGDSGTGKTHLLIALATLAAETGYPGPLHPGQQAGQLTGRSRRRQAADKLINTCGSVDLILVEELGYLQLDRRGAELLFPVLTERKEHSAIAIASNEPFSCWAKTLPTRDCARRLSTG
ncbi:MAG: ATP-binding protein [Mycobacterium sp.]|nr:ATP-binding protein [Mycobacterium sp.]